MILDAFNSIISVLSKKLPLSVSSSAKLSLANSIWIDNSITCKQEYLNTLAELFNATASNIDFSSQAGADAINAWYSENTDGVINDFAHKSNLVKAQFLNATYFKRCGILNLTQITQAWQYLIIVMDRSLQLI